MAVSVSDLVALAVAPIRPDKPEGESVTYEPEFEAVKTEVAKIDSLTGEIPAWGDIQENCLQILKTKSKDLTVASYLMLSLFQRDGYQGLQAGLALYKEMMSTFWDTLFPEIKRMRGRIGAVNWINERVSTAVTKRPASASDGEATKACSELLGQLIAL